MLNCYYSKPSDSKHPPCWIITYPRTGSNYLCAALNHTGEFDPPFQEWLNPKVEARNRPDTHLSTSWWPWLNLKEEVVYRSQIEPLLANLPKYLKIHGFDYEIFFNIEHRQEIEKRLPGIKFIRLRRRNQIACAVSYYLATHTQVFECLEAEREKHASIPVPINKDELKKNREWVYWWDKYWDEFVEGADHLEVFYEDLVTGTETVSKVHAYLGIKPFWAERVLPIIGEKKLKHPQTQELIAILESEQCQL